MSDNDKVDTSESIKRVMERLAASFETETRDAYMAVADTKEAKLAAEAIKNMNGEEFQYHAAYPYEQIAKGVILSETNSTEAQFIFMNYNYVERHFRFWIEAVEGGACSADKSRWVVKSLLRHFMSGTEIKPDYEQKYTYHLPKKIFTNEAEVIDFFTGIHGLNYGRPGKYLKCVADLSNNYGVSLDD